MRENKFRVWDKEDNRMITHEQDFIPLKITNLGVLKLDPCSKDERWILLDKNRFIIMQYAGFKDKNKKEVYEGDIAKAWSQGYCGNFEIKWRVNGGGSPMWLLYPAWENGEMWGIAASREEDGLVYDRGIEIIGNIYENPELLQQK